MPNWCSNSIAFYQEDGGNTMVEAFYADVQKYQDYTDPETGKASDWVGHWLQSNRVDTDNLYTRGFFTSCELYADHVRIDMETAWAPLPEVWDLMAEKYELAYVYIAEEPGCAVYVNTDAAGRFFSTRYMINYFDVDDLGLDAGTMAEYGERLREIGGEAIYFDSFEKAVETFEGFGFVTDDVEELNKRLEWFGITVYEYSGQ
jgi:hypothetical protein